MVWGYLPYAYETVQLYDLQARSDINEMPTVPTSLHITHHKHLSNCNQM